MSSSPSEIPQSVFAGSPEQFLSAMLPEERHRVTVYLLMLLSRIRCTHSTKPDVLRVCALMEMGSASVFALSSTPKPAKVEYGKPPTL